MKIFVAFLLFFTFSLSGYAYKAGGNYFKAGNSHECYIDTYGNDWYWFCGHQTQSCRGVGVGRNDVVKWYNHGEGFTISDAGGGNDGIYWCCNGSSSQQGTWKWVRNGNDTDNPFYSYQTVTETLKDSGGNVIGSCSWRQKKNICGGVENPKDKCTTPTSCAGGYLLIGGKCVLPCPDGEGFASSSSPTCVACETGLRQGINKGVCIKCELNQFFDTATLKCVDKSSRLSVSATAHSNCWLCSTPGAMYNCMKLISNGGELSKNAKLQAACSVNGKEADATDFKLPSSTITVTPLKFKLDLKILKKAPVAAVGTAVSAN